MACPAPLLLGAPLAMGQPSAAATASAPAASKYPREAAVRDTASDGTDAGSSSQSTAKWSYLVIMISFYDKTEHQRMAIKKNEQTNQLLYGVLSVTVLFPKNTYYTIWCKEFNSPESVNRVGFKWGRGT